MSEIEFSDLQYTHPFNINGDHLTRMWVGLHPEKSNQLTTETHNSHTCSQVK